MKIQNIYLSAFRSFNDPQTLSLEELQPGLYLVTGRNEVEPSLGANGAGKSSLFESVFWAFYGKTSRNVKAGNVVNWNAKNQCKVSVELNDRTLKRTQSPNHLQLDGTEIDQATALKFLGIDSDEFLQTVYFSQFTPSFIDLPPSYRMEIYSHVMKLDLWDHKADQAHLLAQAYAKDTIELELRCARLEAAIDGLNSEEVQQRSDAWVQDQEEEWKRLAHELAKVTSASNDLQELIGKDDEQLRKLLLDKQKIKGWMQTAKERVESARLDVGKQQRVFSGANAKIDLLEHRIVGIDEAMAKNSGTCDTCGQVVTLSHLKQHRRQLEQQQDLARKRLSMVQIGVTEAEKEYKEALRAHDAVESTSEERQAEVTEVRTKSERHKATLEQLKTDAQRLRSNSQRISQQVNPYAAEQARLLEKERKLRADLDIADKELDQIRKLVSDFAFWTRGFKDIRLQMIEESLQQLNAETNECLTALGLTDWGLEFSVERETKSGTIRRGFQCEVLNPHTDQKVPWEVWSGGEAQRLRLASQLGVANLLAGRLGFESNVEFWDEPSTWLHEGGIKALLEVLEDRALRYDRIVLLADHRSLDYPFRSVIDVRKTAAGSVLTVS